MVFYLRLDYNRLPTESKLDFEQNNGCVPVFRQDCFIGTLPERGFQKKEKTNKILPKRRAKNFIFKQHKRGRSRPAGVIRI